MSEKIKISVIVETRPNLIKINPLLNGDGKTGDRILNKIKNVRNLRL